MIYSARPQRIRWTVAGLGLSLLLVGAGLSLQGMTNANSHPSSAQTPPLTVDPRLVLRPQAVPFSGTIAGGVALGGTLSPSLPGANTITLRIALPGGRAAQGGHVSLVLSMTGMAMRAVHATLTASGQGYRGSAVLPMFGRYRAEVDAMTAGGRYSGAIGLAMPLSLASSPTGGQVTHPARSAR
jgi:hypothetical protein